MPTHSKKVSFGDVTLHETTDEHKSRTTLKVNDFEALNQQDPFRTETDTFREQFNQIFEINYEWRNKTLQDIKRLVRTIKQSPTPRGAKGIERYLSAATQVKKYKLAHLTAAQRVQLQQRVANPSLIDQLDEPTHRLIEATAKWLKARKKRWGLNDTELLVKNLDLFHPATRDFYKLKIFVFKKKNATRNHHQQPAEPANTEYKKYHQTMTSIIKQVSDIGIKKLTAKDYSAAVNRLHPIYLLFPENQRENLTFINQNEPVKAEKSRYIFVWLRWQVYEKLKTRTVHKHLNSDFSNLNLAAYDGDSADEYNLLLMATIIKATLEVGKNTLTTVDYIAAIASLYPIYIHLREYHPPFSGIFRSDKAKNILPVRLPYFLSQTPWDKRNYQNRVSTKVRAAIQELKEKRKKPTKNRNWFIRACYGVARRIGRMFGIVSTVVTDEQALPTRADTPLDKNTKADIEAWKRISPDFKQLNTATVKKLADDFVSCFKRADVHLTNIPASTPFANKIRNADNIYKRLDLYRFLLYRNPNLLMALATAYGPELQEHLGVASNAQLMELFTIGSMDGPTIKITPENNQYHISIGYRACEPYDQSLHEPEYLKAFHATATVMPGGKVEPRTDVIVDYDSADWNERQLAAHKTETVLETKDETVLESKGGNADGYDSDEEPTAEVKYDPNQTKPVTVDIESNNLHQSKLLEKQGIYKKTKSTAAAPNPSQTPLTESLPLVNP
ncbi:MAG: hypothetical protein P1U63_07000 [Coxiellaceae bacterium]|nr:hypothetical protein [Coxiellaceae bacterium]